MRGRRRDLRLVDDDYKDESKVIDIDDRNIDYLDEIDDNEPMATENSLMDPNEQGPSIEELFQAFFDGEDPETLEQMKKFIDIFKQLEGPIRFIQQIQGPLRFMQQIQGPLRFMQQMQGPLQLVRQLQAPMQMQRPLNPIGNPIVTRQFQHYAQRQMQQQVTQQIGGMIQQQVQGMIQKQIGERIREQIGSQIQNQLPNLLNNFFNKRT